LFTGRWPIFNFPKSKDVSFGREANFMHGHALPLSPLGKF